MNYYKISYSINEKNERVYPKKMKGVVFAMTQDHAIEKVMIGGSESDIAENGKAIIALTLKAAEALIKEFQASFPKPPQDMDIPLPPDPAE